MEKNIFITKARKYHKNYDYSKVPDEFSTRDKVCIICPKHGEFFQRVDTHLSGRGCPKCGHEKTGEACRKVEVKNRNECSSILNKITVINNPNIPYENYILGTIYLLVNTLNNKVYVGQTYRNYISRWSEHKNSLDDLYIHKAIRKYSFDKFNKYVIF